MKNEELLDEERAMERSENKVCSFTPCETQSEKASDRIVKAKMTFFRKSLQKSLNRFNFAQLNFVIT